MYDSSLELRLIYTDIANIMKDYVPMQLDIDEISIKSASLSAQDLELERLIGEDNMLRLIPSEDYVKTDADKELLRLITPALCHFTYSVLLSDFQGSFSDSGYEVEAQALNINFAKSKSKDHKAKAEFYMLKVAKFLSAETPSEEPFEKKMTNRISVFGGKESRSSN